MTPFLAATVAAVAGLATAAVPAEPRTAAAPSDKTAPAANADRTHCFKYQITGSILPYKTCKKLSEWKKEGVDPTAPQS